MKGASAARNWGGTRPGADGQVGNLTLFLLQRERGRVLFCLACRRPHGHRGVAALPKSQQLRASRKVRSVSTVGRTRSSPCKSQSGTRLHWKSKVCTVLCKQARAELLLDPWTFLEGHRWQHKHESIPCQIYLCDIMVPSRQSQILLVLSCSRCTSGSPMLTRAPQTC
jgi:hypothetical protein